MAPPSKRHHHHQASGAISSSTSSTSSPSRRCCRPSVFLSFFLGNACSLAVIVLLVSSHSARIDDGRHGRRGAASGGGSGLLQLLLRGPECDCDSAEQQQPQLRQQQQQQRRGSLSGGDDAGAATSSRRRRLGLRGGEFGTGGDGDEEDFGRGRGGIGGLDSVDDGGRVAVGEVEEDGYARQDGRRGQTSADSCDKCPMVLPQDWSKATLKVSNKLYHQNLKRRRRAAGKELMRFIKEWYDRTESRESLKSADFVLEVLGPTYPCFPEERFGTWLDGGKWVCRPSMLNSSSIVYSIGSRGADSYERDLYGRTLAEIHVFDHTLPPSLQMKVSTRKAYTFHPIGLGITTDHHGKLMTFEDMRKNLGHKFVDILKVDCEGCEFEAIPAILERAMGASVGQQQQQASVDDSHASDGGVGSSSSSSSSSSTNSAVDGRSSVIASAGASSTGKSAIPFGQLQVEVHFITRKHYARVASLLLLLEQYGYRLFHLEMNWRVMTCVELAFVHESLVDDDHPH